MAAPSCPSPYSLWLRLPLQFDVHRMQQECDQFASADWIDHANTGAYDTGWSCLALRAPDGNPRHIMPRDGLAYRATAHLARCPYLRHVLSGFACEVGAARLMALAAGAVIREHTDPGTALADGVTRIHIPIRTSAQVLFHIDGRAVHFTAGHAWYMDASCRHAVANHGTAARVHMVLDCITNDWLRTLFATAGFVPRPAPRYGHRGIHDGNVGELIATLRQSGAPVAQAEADRLAALCAPAAP